LVRCRIFPNSQINNAGVYQQTPTITIDGFDRGVQVNYLGPFLLTSLLINKMHQDGRIINTSHFLTRTVQSNHLINLIIAELDIDELLKPKSTENFDKLTNLIQSKACLSFFTAELQRRLTALQSNITAINIAMPTSTNK
jgi:NAD(P)-dependent dehydrogenase (short-subunit alcohol dehydrogenase family)